MIETGAERTTIVDIFDIIKQARDAGIHLTESRPTLRTTGPVPADFRR